MAGLSLSLLVLALLGTVLVLLLDDEGYRARPGELDAPRARPAAAAVTLDELGDALEAGDRRAATALAPDGDDDARALLAGVAANAGALRLRDVSLRYVTETGPVRPDGSWPASADLTWRIPGVDRGVARTEVSVDLVAEDDGAAVVGLGGGGRRTPVWFAGPARVTRTAGAAVVVASALGRQEAERYAAMVRAAVPRVRAVLPRWHSGLAVEVPATAGGVDEALGARPGQYARVAAVTASADGSTSADAPVRIVVNPEEMGRLGRGGAQVVMTHEAAHVATGAAVSTGNLPLWLVEGFADHVALRDAGLPLSETAGQVARQVRDEGLPARLPTPDEFDTVTGEHLGAAYEAAWLACETIADAAGERALVRTYRSVEAGAALETALRREAGFGVAELTRRWRQRLAALPG